MFLDPDTFNPNQFLRNGVLNPDILDPKDVAFGLGRRVPGHTDGIMAYDTLWITIATVLAYTEICLAKDSVGRKIKVEGEFFSSSVRYVLSFAS